MLSCSSHVRIFATLWTVARQAPLSMGFSRQEYWSGLPCPPPGGLPDPGIEPVSLTSLAWQVGSLALVPPGKPITSTYLFLSWGNLGCLCFTAAASVARDTRGVPPVDLGGRCSEVYTGGWLGYRHMLS